MRNSGNSFDDSGSHANSVFLDNDYLYCCPDHFASLNDYDDYFLQNADNDGLNFIFDSTEYDPQCNILFYEEKNDCINNFKLPEDFIKLFENNENNDSIYYNNNDNGNNNKHENNAQIEVENNLHINDPSIPCQNSPCEHKLLNFQPSNGWFGDSNHYHNPTSHGAVRAPKRRVELDNDEQEFKNKYYSIFTNYKKFDKVYVKKIHNLFLMDHFNFNKIIREEYRRIDLYFKHYSQYKDSILDFLQEHKTEITKVVFDR